MKIKLEITEQDIRLGKQGEPRYCPIARAVKRVVKSGHRDTVYVRGVFKVFVGGVGIILPTVKTRRFIDRFDKGKPVKPFTMVADINEEFLRR